MRKIAAVIILMVVLWGCSGHKNPASISTVKTEYVYSMSSFALTDGVIYTEENGAYSVTWHSKNPVVPVETHTITQQQFNEGVFISDYIGTITYAYASYTPVPAGCSDCLYETGAVCYERRVCWRADGVIMQQGTAFIGSYATCPTDGAGVRLFVEKRVSASK
jgi:hypothetical protein